MSASLQEPKPKKAKVEDNNGTKNEEEDAKSPSLAEAQRNEQGEAYFELSKTRRVTIRQFKGKTLVDIREVCTVRMIHVDCCADYIWPPYLSSSPPHSFSFCSLTHHSFDAHSFTKRMAKCCREKRELVSTMINIWSW